MAAEVGQRPGEPEWEDEGSAAAMAEHDDAARGKDLEERELRAIVEALLFVSHDPVPVERLRAALGEVSQAEIRQAFKGLREDFDREGRGVQLVEVAGGYQIVTRLEYAPWIKRLAKARITPRLSRSAMESLAIIAYKQPVVRAEIEKIRGVETSSVLRTLLERKLIRMLGRKDVPGRPIMYGTTKVFLQQFGLRDLSELPPLREFQELGESEQARLPVEDDVGPDGAGAVAAGVGSRERPAAPDGPDQS